MELLPSLAAALDFSTLPQQLINGLLQGAIYALIALGYTMVYGVLRLINFAHGEVYMLGGYVALFISYALGFRPGESGPSSAFNLLLMLLGSMTLCAIVGVLIERFAYRPMRSHSRIASLITAIGVSLFFQYGGALFLPNSPPPAINEQVNPFRSTSFTVTLVPESQALIQKAQTLKPEMETTQAAFDAYMAAHPEASRFNLPPEGEELRNTADAAKRAYEEVTRQADNSASRIKVQAGQLIIFVTTLVLMGVLTYLVLFTKAGRAMRAVSLDFDAAALMGVNVNNVVVWTFVIGSALAGAGSMMQATFLATPLTTFYGVQPGLKAFVAAVLGGIGNIPGAVLGGFLMGVVELLVIWSGYSEWRDAFAFVVLIVVLLVRPGGLLGSNKVEKV
jgi:branched-chain amino acid transport system permease protein